MFHGYTLVLIGELRGARIPVPPLPHIPGRGPIVPPGLLGNLGSFAKSLGPS